MRGHGNSINVDQLTTNKVPVYYISKRNNREEKKIDSTYASIGPEQPGEKLLLKSEFLKRTFFCM